MTFKHTKFEDSPIMRSLERVAQEKGLIKTQPLNKTAAAKKIDLTPTINLLDNVLKLCAGLRERGFEKQANDLEVYLINYKKAQTLYETFPEKGEDLIHAAHPKGSHKLEGIDAADEGSVVEDILDQYAKSLEMVNKRPTGKLSSAEAIKAVKVTLGATPLALAQNNNLYDTAKDTIDKFRSVYDTVRMAMGDDAGENDQYLNMLKGILDRKEVYKFKDFATYLTRSMNSLRNAMEPSYLSFEHSSFSPEQEQKWQSIQKYFPILKKYADRFNIVVSKILSIESNTQAGRETEEGREADPERSDLEPIINKLTILINRLTQYSTKVSKYPSATNYINTEIGEIKNIINKINQEGATPELNALVAEKEKEVNDFASSWKLIEA